MLCYRYKEDDSDAPRQELFKTFFDADNYSNITVDQAKNCASQDLMRAEMQPCFREMMVPEIEQLWGPIEVYLAVGNIVSLFTSHRLFCAFLCFCVFMCFCVSVSLCLCVYVSMCLCISVSLCVLCILAFICK